MSGRTRATARRWLAGALVGSVVLAGCGGLPTDKEPQVGRQVLGQPRQGVGLQPAEPQAQASPDEIVRGFLRANVIVAGDDHEVARSFLTDELARRWVPSSHVLVYEGAPEVTSPEAGSAEVTSTMLAEVDSDGVLSERSGAQPRTDTFDLTRVDGEWRISDFPENFGLMLTRTDFELGFLQAQIHYVSPVQDVFVPITRWYALDDGLPTTLASAQLGPVPEVLRGAVLPVAPDELDLVTGSVPVDTATGTAEVDLSGADLSDAPSRVGALWAELIATLTQVGGVRQVSLLLNGQPPQGTGVVSEQLPSLEGLGYASAERPRSVVILRQGRELSLVNPRNYALREVTSRPGDGLPELPTVPIGWVDLAADAEVEQFAAVAGGTRDVLWRWRDGKEAKLPGIGADLTAPMFDQLGDLWVAGDSSAGPRAWVLDGQARLSTVAKPVEAEWLQRWDEVDDFRVAPDGQRIVVHVRDTNSDVEGLLLAGVVRDRDGVPVSLTEPEPVAPTLTSITSVRWASSTDLAILGRRATDSVDTPFLQTVGGWIDDLTVESGATQVRAVPTEDGYELMLLSADSGRIFTTEGSGWRSYRNGEDVVVPGH